MSSQGFRKPLRPANISRHVKTNQKVENICSILSNTPPSSPDCEEEGCVNPVPKKVRVSKFVKSQDATSAPTIAEHSKEMEMENVETKGLQSNYTSSSDGSANPRTKSNELQPILPENVSVDIERNPPTIQQEHHDLGIDEYDDDHPDHFMRAEFQFPIKENFSENISFKQFSENGTPLPSQYQIASKSGNKMSDTIENSDEINSNGYIESSSKAILVDDNLKRDLVKLTRKPKKRKHKSKTFEDPPPKVLISNRAENQDESFSVTFQSLSAEHSSPVNLCLATRGTEENTQTTSSLKKKKKKKSHNESEKTVSSRKYGKSEKRNSQALDEAPSLEVNFEKLDFMDGTKMFPQSNFDQAHQSSLDRNSFITDNTRAEREYPKMNNFFEIITVHPPSNDNEEAPVHGTKKNKKSSRHRKKKKLSDLNFQSNVSDWGASVFEIPNIDLTNSSVDCMDSSITEGGTPKKNDDILEEIQEIQNQNIVLVTSMNARQNPRLLSPQNEENPNLKPLDPLNEKPFKSNLNDHFKKEKHTEAQSTESENLFDVFQNDSSIQNDGDFDAVFNKLVQLGYQYFAEPEAPQSKLPVKPNLYCSEILDDSFNSDDTDFWTHGTI